MKRQNKETQLRNIFKISVIEGILGQVFNTVTGPGSAFLTKFAIMLNATPLQFAILAAIGQISQVFQPLGAIITKRRRKRKDVVLALLFTGRGITLLYAILPFVFFPGSTINAFLLIFFISVSLQAVANNAWIGWVTDLLPLSVRGRFFSVRLQYGMLTAVGVSYVFSLFIDRFSTGFSRGSLTQGAAFFKAENLPLGFAMIFFIAMLSGFSGLGVLSRQPEKEKKIEEEGSAAGIVFLLLRDRNFRRFLLYTCWWMLAVGIGAPFWQPFMMQKLHMSLFEVQIYGSIHVVASILVLRLWGRLIDAYGNRTAMRLIILLGGFNPMVWLFVTSNNYPILYLEAITSGVMWSGAGLVATNFVLAIAPKERRQLSSGLAGAFSGVAMMTTMLASGALLPQRLETTTIYLEPEQVLFALSGIARWSTQIPLTWVHEPGAKPVREAIAFFFREMKPRFMK